MAVTAPPTPEISRAFGVSGGRPRRLVGGQGGTWLLGDVVFKPVGDPVEHAWVCDVFATWRHHDEVRVPTPLSAPDGSWAYAGWAAHAFVSGRDARIPDELEAVRAASDAFHARISGLAMPEFLSHRDDPWAFGDRVAWEGMAPEGGPVTRELIDRLLRSQVEMSAPPQLVHGDVVGNVLVDEGLPPAVIDWPPYYRPVGFALAVAATDAITWQGAPLGLLGAWSDVPEWDQLLPRALVYRLATIGRLEQRGQALELDETHERSRPVVDAVLARLSDR